MLWRGANIRQTGYQTADLRVSDHRPVWSMFDCVINVVDLGLKDSLRRLLYKEKQDDALSDSPHLLDLEDEDSMAQVSIAPGLPPASSDRTRWWLDQGMWSDGVNVRPTGLIHVTGAPVKATVRPPAEKFIANPQRKSNPFSMDTEPDWVPHSGLMGKEADARTDRKPVPPPRQQAFDRSESAAPRSASSTMSKSPPAVPRKPLALSSHGGVRSPVSGSDQGAWATPRSSTGAPDLLGDDADEQIEWKPLLPR